MCIDFLIEIFKQNSENPAIVFNDKIYMYADLLNKFIYWDNYLKTKQIHNHVIAVNSEYNPDSIALLLAIIENLNIIVPLNPDVKNIKEKIKIAEAEYIFKFKQDSVTFDKTGYTASHELIKQLQKNNHPGIILFSSGSTGVPKAALHDFDPFLNKYKIKRNASRTLLFLLFDHIGGINTLFHILSNGSLAVLPTERTADEVCELTEKYKIELLPITPTFINLILLSKAYEKYDLNTLKVVTYGTEAMPEFTLKRFHELFPDVKMQQTYGLTELGIMRTKSRSSNSLWLQVGGEDYGIKIIDGILYIKARTSILGYLNAVSPFNSEGWYNTGDLVEQDGEWIKFLGRESEIINVGGLKVFPTEVESAITEISFVSDSIVYGEKNLIMGQIVVADVMFNEKADNIKSKNEIRKLLRVKLDNYKIPVKINIVDNINFNERFKKIRR